MSQERNAEKHGSPLKSAIPTCTDVVTGLSDSKEELQTLVDEGDDYSTLERDLLQLVMNVVLYVPGRVRKPVDTKDFVLTTNGEPMPVVQEATHMCIDQEISYIQ